MAKTHRIFEVFIASPVDVEPEREALETVVSEFNRTWSDTHRANLELVKWETHSRPAVGRDAQDVINGQVSSNYDIFLGIMWGRFGTATARAGSGTEEEFQIAYDRLKKGDRVQIMFYFKDAGIPPSEVDAKQIAQVQSFKRKIIDEYGGLYCKFETRDDFLAKAREHLSKTVQDLLDASGSNVEPKTALEEASLEPDGYNPLANLAAIDDSEVSEGIFDLMDRGNRAIDLIVQTVGRMTDITRDLAENFTRRTSELESIKDNSGRLATKKVANNVASNLEVFVERMSSEVIEYHSQNAIFFETVNELLLIEKESFKDDHDIEIMLNNMKKYRTEIEGSHQSLAGLKRSVANIPRLTTASNRAKRRAVAVMDDLLEQFQVAFDQAGEIESQLASLIALDRDEPE